MKRLEHQSLNRQRSINNNSNDIEQTVIKRKIPRKETIVQNNENVQQQIQSNPIQLHLLQFKQNLLHGQSINYFFHFH